jgi:23S rRNA (uracil1939-C5)-methyltransferase
MPTNGRPGRRRPEGSEAGDRLIGNGTDYRDGLLVLCPHAPGCVPCPFRGLQYREQLARKRRRVERAMATYPSLRDTWIEEPIGSRDLFGYRNVAKLAVRAGRGGRLRAGVYAPGSHRLVDAERCAVQHPGLTEVVVAALEEAARLRIEAYDERRGTGELRYLVARYSAWMRRTLLVLVSARADDRALRELGRQLGRRCHSLGGIVVNHNGDRGNVILGRRFATLRPPAELVERIGFLKLRVSPASFLQSNVWTARRIYEKALEWAAPGAADRVVDLFCGIGPLSLYLATRANEVVGIEESAAAIRDARSNARRNGFHNARFEEGRAEDALPRIRTRLGRASVVTLNPTRKGASRGALEGIALMEPQRLVYVSCDAATLARDLDRLSGFGYRTIRLQPFDMLPQTEHVEVVALVEKTAHDDRLPVNGRRSSRAADSRLYPLGAASPETAHAKEARPPGGCVQE